MASLSLLAQAPSLAEHSSLQTSLSFSTVLPVDTAFSLQAFVEADQSVALLWEITPGYYLYRQSISITKADGSSSAIDFPAGSQITDEYFGTVEVYYDKLLLKVPVSQLTANGVDKVLHFVLGYQGCAKDLYCYPPLQKDIQLTLP